MISAAAVVVTKDLKDNRVVSSCHETKENNNNNNNNNNTPGQIKKNDLDSDDDTDDDEGLELLLGGLNVQDISIGAWDDESDSEEATSKAAEPKNIKQESSSGTITNGVASVDAAACCRRYHVYQEPEELNVAFQYAFAFDSNSGVVQRPPVQVIQFDAADPKGKALVATRSICKGETIYTERAAVATQIPKRTDDKMIRACQFCFRSLEPISSLIQKVSSGENNNKKEQFPLAHLWPVPEFDFSELSDNDDVKLRVDKFKRIHCTECNAWFCHQYCLALHEKEVGDHCLCRKALGLLVKNDKDDNHNDEIQAPVALATRMFCIAVHRFRYNKGGADALDRAFWMGLCGSAHDVTALELGSLVHDDGPTKTYTLQPLYHKLVNLLNLKMEEQSYLSLECLERFAAMAARNGFGICTQSPFSSYYNSSLRHAGGRGTEQHDAIKSQVAIALGSSTGLLERGMDRSVQDRVAPEIVAIFPLTARINHSCCAAEKMIGSGGDDNNATFINAQVMSQVFTDCHVDLVATCPIAVGQEIWISYLMRNTLQKNTIRRRHELWAKYLFDCACPKCIFYRG